MKKRTEKQMIRYSILMVLIMLPMTIIAIHSFFLYQEWYVQLSLLGLMAIGLVNIWIYGRCLVDKSYRRKCFIAQNDERYKELIHKAAYVTTIVQLGLLGGLFGFVLSYDADGGLLMVPLRVLIISLLATSVVVFFASLLILEKIG